MKADGISDMIKGLHHYGFTKVVSLFEQKNEREKTQKWIDQMLNVKEKEFTFKN